MQVLLILMQCGSEPRISVCRPFCSTF